MYKFILLSSIYTYFIYVYIRIHILYTFIYISSIVYLSCIFVNFFLTFDIETNSKFAILFMSIIYILVS